MKENNIVTIKTESKIIRLNEAEIYSITVNSGILSFTLENEEVISGTGTLKEVLNELPYFVRINNNCAVNSMYIREICRQSRRIGLTNKVKHKISVRRIKQVSEITLSRYYYTLSS